jgi:hypothetical protein
MELVGKIKAFIGTHNMSTHKLGNISSGQKVIGNATGIITGYDYKDLYSLYGIPLSEPTPAWITAFQKDKDKNELKKAFHRLNPINKMHSLDFWMQGNDTNIQEMDIHYGVIRLQWGLDVKNFVILNNSSVSAATTPKSGLMVVPYGGFFPFTKSGLVV